MWSSSRSLLALLACLLQLPPRTLPKEPLPRSDSSFPHSLSLFREGNANEEERYKITAFAVAGEKTTGPLNWKGSHFGSFVAEAKVNLGKYRKAGQDRTSLIDPVFLKLFVVDILGLIRRWAEPAAGHRGVEKPPPPPPPRLHILIMRLSMTKMNSDGSRHFGNGPSL